MDNLISFDNLDLFDASELLKVFVIILVHISWNDGKKIAKSGLYVLGYD